MSARDSVNLWRILSDTTRVINAHSRHFLALSILFILPMSISALIYPSLVNPPPNSIHHHYYARHSRYLLSTLRPEKLHTVDQTPPLVLIQFLYVLVVQLFGLCAAASIIYTAFHGFYGEPVKFVSSIKSILFSFFPLLATTIVAEIIFALIMVAFALLIFLAYNLVSSFGIVIDYDSTSFLVFVIIFAVLLFGVLIYLQSKWYVSNSVVVLESKWGFSPLKRSSYLLKGMKGVVLSLLLFFGVLSVFLAVLSANMVATPGGWSNWQFVLKAVVYTVFLTGLSLYAMVANAVLFVYCKAKHGEAALEVANEEFGTGYVRLPFKDGKDTYVVNVV